MKILSKSIFMLAISPALALSLSVQAEVKHRQMNDSTRVSYVSSTDWQPDDFSDNGTSVQATHMIDAGITLDGRVDEIQWKNAKEVTVPLSYGGIKEVTLKALYTDKEVYLAVSWPDETKDNEHHPWVWNTGLQQYEEGPQVEDSVFLSFEAGCEWTPSLLSGYIYDFDAWHWLAARSDPVGQALDLYGNVQDRYFNEVNYGPYPPRDLGDHWQMKFTENHDVDMNASWDEIDRAYLWQPVADTIYVKAIPDGGPRSPAYFEMLPPPQTAPISDDQSFPQYNPIKLSGSAGEVLAKGHWQDGYWTVEFRRDLVTPVKHIYDTIFNRLVQFSVHAFDQTDQLDEASESGRLFLEFLPADFTLVDNQP